MYRSSVVGITFLYRSVPDQLDHYPITTRPYTSGLGREQVAYKPNQAVVELGRGIWAIGTVKLI